MVNLPWLIERPIAHRGLHDLNKRRWENTQSAFSAAIDHGYAIECDVQLTEDNVPVIFHDYDLKRLTGQNGLIHQITASIANGLQIGTTTETIMTLANLLDMVNGKVPLIIELKSNPDFEDEFVNRVLTELEPYQSPVALMSFDLNLIKRLFQLDSEKTYGLIIDKLDGKAIAHDFPALTKEISFLSVNIEQLPDAFIHYARTQLHMPVITWTVRNKHDVDKTQLYADQMTFEGFLPSYKATETSIK